METSALYDKIEKENINYINAKLLFTRGAIAHCNNLTAIVVDDNQIKSQVSENTVLIQELGHYMAGAYYRTNSQYELIDKMEHKADKKSWQEFLPYEKIIKLMKNGLTTATQLAEYFNVEVPYMARCLNYYYNNSHGFTDDKVSV
ncbi:MAG: hypothetical protein HFJ40_06050 [Clostridia bacterium]|nr:hypothetical protein [Clostridia bacterium]